HVDLADEAWPIGPPPARESYLSIDRILDAARNSGAEAVHPGYGFLSENAEFAEACAAAGVTFIGPSAPAIRAIGSKAAARTLMLQSGVPVVPGYHGEDQGPGHLVEEAERIGFPVLIKAVAGGGGRGMRVVGRADEFAAALVGARREAAGAFGDDRMLIEKYLPHTRHIEFQIFADNLGNTTHLFERDCSIQRRHQKVLEEAPAPGLDAERRRAMGKAAVAAARAVGYVGAGTVEFIVEGGAFYFMEMNTRLQVEHPVTEMITGLDLVEWQLRVACGEPLPRRQDQLAIDGHAIEARIYAEDPDKGFLPSTGRLTHLAPPAASAHVRVDTGVEQGDEITPHYDPMIAKLIVWGADRRQALARMRQALAQYRVVGVQNNVEFLARLIALPAFAEADLDTGLIEREHEALFPQREPVPAEVWLLAALAEVEREQRQAERAAAGASDRDSPWRRLDGWRLNGRATRQLLLRAGEVQQAVGIESQAGGGLVLTLGGQRVDARASLGPDSELQAQLGERRVRAAVVAAGERRHVFFEGRSWPLALANPLQAGVGSNEAEGSLRAPMPGKVIALAVAAGALVDKGAALLVMEAMKMEHTIAAPCRGRVKSFHFEPGDQVGDGADLLAFEPEG
ncbi:MAG: 3-methylcrotonyl-CoA carboxylase, partial [Burkholderiales bacterium]|nr:3-methylcrotonyl-CoA carboxylase [Burkholderiales bacterium]